MPCVVEIENVSLRFRKYTYRSQSLKESVMHWFGAPPWAKNRVSKNSATEFWGLKEVSLEIREGDRVGIVGHNGAGKSSLLRVISRIYKPTRGRVQVRGRIAPLIEIGAGFSPELTGRENAFLNGAVLGISHSVIEERLNNIIEFAELQEFIDTPVKYYSTGMYLRLAFTLATEIAPDILILDELYAGGDHAFIEKANLRLDKFVERSRVLVLVAHDMNYIRRFCNRVVILDHGRIIFDGEVEAGVSKYQTLAKHFQSH